LIFGLDAISLLLFLGTLIIGFLIIVFVVKLVVVLVPAGIVALIVWWVTNNPLYTGVAFLLVALISLVKKL
jgi:hypothetical protein